MSATAAALLLYNTTTQVEIKRTPTPPLTGGWWLASEGRLLPALGPLALLFFAICVSLGPHLALWCVWCCVWVPIDWFLLLRD